MYKICTYPYNIGTSVHRAPPQSSSALVVRFDVSLASHALARHHPARPIYGFAQTKHNYYYYYHYRSRTRAVYAARGNILYRENNNNNNNNNNGK